MNSQQLKREVKFEEKQGISVVKAENSSENKNPEEFDDFVNQMVLNEENDDDGKNGSKQISPERGSMQKKQKSLKQKKNSKKSAKSHKRRQSSHKKQKASPPTKNKIVLKEELDNEGQQDDIAQQQQGDKFHYNRDQDEEDDSEDDAYYEEELKRQNVAKKFFDLDAEVDNGDAESEDQYLEQQGLNEVEQAQQLQQQLYRSDYRKQHAKILQEVQHKVDLKEVAQNYNQRVRNIERQDSKDPLLKQSRLPQMSDPKLWLIRLRKSGVQKQVAISILNKAIAKAQSSVGKRMSILSACAIDNLPGYIYVEAFKLSHVREAVQGNNLVMHGKGYKMVPVYQMVDVFKSGKSAILNLKPGDWVRIRSGMYANDLAKVQMIEKGLQSVLIRMIPRLETIIENAGSEGRELNTKQREQVKIMRSQRIRPNQHHFMPISEQELQHQPYNAVLYKQNPDDGLYYSYWNRMMFREGFIFKKISIKSLMIDNIIPNQKEIDMFDHKVKNAFDKYNPSNIEQDDEDVDDDDNENIKKDDEKQDTKNSKRQQLDVMNQKIRRNKMLKQCFKIGDVIEIIESALNGLQGQIIALGPDKATIKPRVQQIPDLQIPYDSLSKMFNEGDYVQVIGGSRNDLIGVTGMITTMWNDYTISVYSNHLKKEIKVKANDLSKYSEKNDVSLKRMSSVQNDYNKFDLVQLIDSKIFGVILKFSNLNITIVTNDNNLLTVPISDITHKIQTQSNTGMDCRNNAMMINDKVNIVQGEYKSHNGAILHIKSNFAFIRIMDLIKDRTTGVRCQNLRNLKMIGSNEFVDKQKEKMKYKNQSLISGPLKVRRDPLIGKRVIVIDGQWKLQQGIVLEANEQGYRIELSSRNKKITVQKCNVKQMREEDERQVKFQERRFKHQPGGGGKTPIMSAVTPAYGFNTPNSPAWGGSGAFTPSSYTDPDYNPLKSPGHKR